MMPNLEEFGREDACALADKISDMAGQLAFVTPGMIASSVIWIDGVEHDLLLMRKQ